MKNSVQSTCTCVNGFKICLFFLQHIQKYGSAFLNSDGGTLCIGVSDEGYANISL